MMTGPGTTLPLCVPAKAHLYRLPACKTTSSVSRTYSGLSALLHDSAFMTLNVISQSRNYTTAIVQHSPSKTAVFTWQQCLLAEAQNIVAHKIFIRASCLIVVWSICCANCGAELTFPWKNTVSCELLVRFNSNKMDMRGNGFQPRQRGVWPDSQEENISAKCQAFFFFKFMISHSWKMYPQRKEGIKAVSWSEGGVGGVVGSAVCGSDSCSAVSRGSQTGLWCGSLFPQSTRQQSALATWPFTRVSLLTPLSRAPGRSAS